MKKYLALWSAILFSSCSLLMAADVNVETLLSRLDSNDRTGEKDVAVRTGVYTGETSNPLADTVKFKARDEFMAWVHDNYNSADETAKIRQFVLDSMSADVQVGTKVWLLSQMAYLGTAEDVPAIAALLDNSEQRIVDAAAAALAKIPGDEALNALNAKKDLPEAQSALTSRFTPVPPIRPNETKRNLSLANEADADFEAWTANFANLSDEEKADTIAAIAVRGDRKYRQIVLDVLASDASEDLKFDAYVALLTVGTKDDIDILFQYLPKYFDLTIRMGKCIVAEGFDEALKARMEMTTDNDEFFACADMIMIRGKLDVRDLIYAKTLQKNCEKRLRLLYPAATKYQPSDLRRQVESVLLIPRDTDENKRDSEAGDKLVAACCEHDAAPLTELLDEFPPERIYAMICRTGGESAKKAFLDGLASDNQKIRNAAINSLTLWPDAVFAEKMMSMMNDPATTANQKLRLLRSYIRVITLPNDQLNIPLSKEEQLEKIKEVYKMATRPEEKELILSRLKPNRSMASLDFALECANDPQMAEAAYRAIADHAHDRILKNSNKDKMWPAMDLVIENSKDPELIKRVQGYKQN